MSEDEERIAQQALEGTGTRDEWLVARKALLEREKELTRRSDELAKERSELPWVRLEKNYGFETDGGTKTLVELFAGRSQLLVYHFMFGPEYTAGCPICSAAADTFDGSVVHLNHRGVTFLCVSRAPLEKLQAYKRRMGWNFPWVSSLGSDFNFDFGVSFTEEQQREGVEYNYRSFDLAPIVDGAAGTPLGDIAASTGTDPAGYMSEAHGLSAFARADAVVYHTYSCYARGPEFLLGFYPLLDRAPLGRNEGDASEGSRPERERNPGIWFGRHDEYEDGAGAGRRADQAGDRGA
jgi:predicted dithiol-disulfide oxidoreductase (DUF899 family)